jgi:hypothetical protein
VTQPKIRNQIAQPGILKRIARLLVRESSLLILVLSLTAQVAAASSGRISAPDGPEAVVEITRRDVGDVFAGEEIEYAFIVRNAGTKPLELSEKSSVSSRSASSGYAPAAAMWRREDRLFTRPVAATRAAPT